MSTREPDASTDCPEAPESTASLRCDTCGRLSPVVSRVVIDEGYDRSNARPLWNCPECYEKKDQRRKGSSR